MADRHIEDHRTGKNWCFHAAHGVPSLTPLTRRIGRADCYDCIESYRQYRRMTAAAACAGTSFTPDGAELRFRWGDDSGSLRKRLQAPGEAE